MNKWDFYAKTPPLGVDDWALGRLVIEDGFWILEADFVWTAPCVGCERVWSVHELRNHVYSNFRGYSRNSTSSYCFNKDIGILAGVQSMNTDTWYQVFYHCNLILSTRFPRYPLVIKHGLFNGHFRILDLRYLAYIRPTPKIWPNIWYSTSILGSWRSPIDLLKNDKFIDHFPIQVPLKFWDFPATWSGWYRFINGASGVWDLAALWRGPNSSELHD